MKNTNDGQASEIEDGDHQADVQYFNPKHRNKIYLYFNCWSWERRNS